MWGCNLLWLLYLRLLQPVDSGCAEVDAELMFTSKLVPCYLLRQIKCNQKSPLFIVLGGGGGDNYSLHPHRCVNTHVSLGLPVSRMSSTSCGLSVTPAPTCSCCASALLVPPPSKTFLKSGSRRSGDTPPPRRSSLSGRSATYEKMSRWKKRILPNTHIYSTYSYASSTNIVFTYNTVHYVSTYSSSELWKLRLLLVVI